MVVMLGYASLDKFQDADIFCASLGMDEIVTMLP